MPDSFVVRHPNPPASARASTPPALAGTSAFERASIERACAQAKASPDPSNYDSCLRYQMVTLSRSPRPDLSRATAAEVLVLESACADERNEPGPAGYYDCLRREMTRLGIR